MSSDSELSVDELEQLNNEQHITRAMRLERVYAASVNLFLKTYNVAAVSPYEYTFKGVGRIDLNDLLTRFHSFLVYRRAITKESPKGFWLELLERRVKEMYKEQVAAMSARLKYDGSKRDAGIAELSKLVEAISVGSQPLTVATLQHFIWQVKRKMLGKPVAYHMMPILYGVKQGTGKTTAITNFLKPISTDYIYSGLTFDKMGDDRYYPLYELYPVIFFDEMPKTNKADVELIKTVVTSATLNGRILGKHLYKNYAQRSTFIGATNATPDMLVKDTSGMRRFHYIEARADMDWEVISKFDAELIWQSVDECQNEVYIAPYKKELEIVQEETRDKDILECFIEEGYLIAGGPHPGDAFVTRHAYDVFREYAERSGHVKNIIALQTFNKQLLNRYGFSKVPQTNKNLPVKFYGVLDTRVNRAVSLINKGVVNVGAN